MAKKAHHSHKKMMFPELECTSSEIICPFTELSLFERLSQLVNQQVKVLSQGIETKGNLADIQFMENDTSFSVNSNQFLFSEIQKIFLLDEATDVSGFNALIKFRTRKTRKSVRLVTIGSGYVEIIMDTNDIKRRIIIPRRRLQDIICVTKPFLGRPENITLVQRLRPFINSEIGIQIPPRGRIPASVTLLGVTTESLLLQDETGRIFDVNFINTPVILEIPGDFTQVLTLISIESTKGEIDLTLNLNRLGLDFIEASNPQPPFLYFLIPLNPFITIECVEEEE